MQLIWAVSLGWEVTWFPQASLLPAVCPCNGLGWLCYRLAILSL